MTNPDPKPWVARTWAGGHVLGEARFETAFLAQETLSTADLRSARVTIDYEPRVGMPEFQRCGFVGCVRPIGHDGEHIA